MDRRHKVYLILTVALAAIALSIIAIYNFLAMLSLLLIIILALGLLYQRKPEFFTQFHCPREELLIPKPETESKSNIYVPNLYLISEVGDQPLRVAVDHEVFTIGRDARCNFVINDASVSRVHAVLRYDSITKISTITDKSSYGTLLNNRKLKRGEPVPLKQGDVLQITSAVRYTVEQAHY